MGKEWGEGKREKASPGQPSNFQGLDRSGCKALHVQKDAGFFVVRSVLAGDKAKAGLFSPRERAVCG